MRELRGRSADEGESQLTSTHTMELAGQGTITMSLPPAKYLHFQLIFVGAVRSVHADAELFSTSGVGHPRLRAGERSMSLLQRLITSFPPTFQPCVRIVLLLQLNATVLFQAAVAEIAAALRLQRVGCAAVRNTTLSQ